jgi:hypothetical protein
MDWLQALIPVIFIVFWVLSQVMGGDGAKKKQAPPQGQPAPPNNDGGVRGEIDSFLRQMKEQAGIPVDGEDEDWDDIEDVEPTARPQVMEAELVDPHGSPLTARHSIDQTDERFDARSERLGMEVGSADEKMDSHVHQVFDHELSAIGHESDEHSQDTDGAPSISRRKVSKVAGDIRQMLSGAQGVRKAVIMSEIINRPDDRW